MPLKEEEQHIKTGEEVLQILSESYKDFIVDLDKDYLSFSTVLDIYLSNPSDYSDSENIAIIEKLIEIFNQDHDLIYEIGWDIPELVLGYFVSKEFFFYDTLSKNKKIVVLFRLFDLLARYGNPKELFLKSSEILSQINFNDENEFKNHIDVSSRSQFDDEIKQKLLYVKFHALFELHVTSFRRITTMYPSKFLLMTVTTVLKYFNNNVVYLANPTLPMRRIYTFSRDYIPPLKPQDFDPIHNEDHRKVQEDEDYLQGKLLQHFITTGIEVASKYFPRFLAITYYEQLIEKHLNKKFHTKNAMTATGDKASPTAFPASNSSSSSSSSTLTSATVAIGTSSYASECKSQFDSLLDRYFQLGLSMDLDFEDIFAQQVVKASYKIFEPILNNKNINNKHHEDDVTREVFQVSNNHFLQSLKGIDNNKIASAQLQIPWSALGCFILVSDHNLRQLLESDFKKLSFKMSVKDSVMLTLRYLIPVLTLKDQAGVELRAPPNNPIENEAPANETFSKNVSTHYQSLQDAIVFWNWLAISNQNLQHNDILELTASGSQFQILTKVFLQSLISLISVFQSELRFKKIVLTYLMKFLSLSEEQFAWEFLIVSLETCPYLTAKIELINILKDLAVRSKTSNGVLANHKPNEITITDGLAKVSLSSTTANKPTPPPRTYISLSTDRKIKLLRLVHETLDDMFGDNSSETTLVGVRDEQLEFQLLLTYLNLVYTLKQKFTLEELQTLHTRINQGVTSDSANSNNTGLLELFNIKIQGYISQAEKV